MSQLDEQQHDALQEDLACPKCEYNLRGLYGDVVSCPECGEKVDVPQLQKILLNKKSLEIPGYKTLSMPGIVVAIIILVLAIRYSFSEVLQYHAEQKYVILVVCEILSIIWLILMGRVWYVFRSMRGILLALVSHYIWVVAILKIIVVLFALVLLLASPFFKVEAATAVAVLIISGCLIWAASKVEKWVMRQCILIYNKKNAISHDKSE